MTVLMSSTSSGVGSRDVGTSSGMTRSNPVAACTSSTVTPGWTERSRIECSQPQDNLRLGADWRRQPFGGILRLNRYGEYCSFTNPAQFDQTFSPEWVTDVEIAYTLKPLTFAVGMP